MPKNKPEKSNSSWGKKLPFGNIQFVLNNLTKDELADMDARDWTIEDRLLSLSDLLEQGYTLSLKWDVYSEAHQATLIQAYEKQPNAGFAISGRGEDLIDALTIVVYKYYVVADGNLGEFEIAKENIRG